MINEQIVEKLTNIQEELSCIRRELTLYRVKSNNYGDIFLNECRSIIEECSNLKERAARVAIFALCVMLDGSGEHIGPEYVLSVRNKNGDLEPVKFNHHDL